MGVITSVGLAHMVDATQHVGKGSGWRVITSAALAHIVDATQDMGWGCGGFFLFWLVRHGEESISTCLTK